MAVGAMPRDSLATADDRIEGSRFLAEAARQCRFDTHPVDIRLSLPLLFKRFYFVVLGGPERRSAERRKTERARRPLLKLANLFFLVGSAAIGTLVGATVFTPLFVWSLGS